MDLSQTFTYTFTTEEVVYLRLFFKSYLNKLGQGELRDQLERLRNTFEEKLLRSQWQGINENDKKPF